VANEEYKAVDMEVRRQRLEEEEEAGDGYTMDGTLHSRGRAPHARGASWDDDRFSYLRRRSSLGSHPSARYGRRTSSHHHSDSEDEDGSGLVAWRRAQNDGGGSGGPATAERSVGMVRDAWAAAAMTAWVAALAA